MPDFSIGAQPVFAFPQAPEDNDSQGTREWLSALDGIVHHVGRDRAQYLFDRLAAHALANGIATSRASITPYSNTIPVDQQLPYPGDVSIEEKLAAALRWNALAMVVRANRAYGELGGHIASNSAIYITPSMNTEAHCELFTF